MKGISDADLKQFPVEHVSWEDVQEFLKRLNAREKDSGFLYRLPTEAEWEYACRGGASSQEDCDFDFYLVSADQRPLVRASQLRRQLPRRQCIQGPVSGRTSKVGSYKPNRLGIYDMHGNVWEWCDDHYYSRPGLGPGDPGRQLGSTTGPAAGRRSAAGRSRRTGATSWASASSQFRPASRAGAGTAWSTGQRAEAVPVIGVSNAGSRAGDRTDPRAGQARVCFFARSRGKASSTGEGLTRGRPDWRRAATSLTVTGRAG